MIEGAVRGHHRPKKHQDGFGTFGKMVQRYGSALRLRLWHEITVLPADGQTFKYLNCHSETGLLPYFASQDLSRVAGCTLH